MNTASGQPFPRPGPAEYQGQATVSILEGTTVQPTPDVAGARPIGQPIRAVLRGKTGAILFDSSYLSKHVLFLGGIGTGKTKSMMQLVRDLRASAEPEDVFVFFDTKGDFLEEFGQRGDAVISSDPTALPEGAEVVVWNVFKDLLDQDPADRGDQVFEIASTIFSEDLSRASQNFFFAAAARDVFAAALEAMSLDGQPHSNEDLRMRLEGSTKELVDLIRPHPQLAGAARYLTGQGNRPSSVRAFLQQTVNTCFSGAFRLPGDFSVRHFVRNKGQRALFIEYDIAIGSRLLPIYRVLLDMAIKEALSLGRTRPAGSVFFVLDEFALLPELSHITDGINFGRSLGLKFVAGTQNVDQVLHAYGPEMGRTILSGFGTVFAFRLMDDGSRELVRQRFGANRKQITTWSPVRAHGAQQEVLIGNVIEDWILSGLQVGNCIVTMPEGPPFFFTFEEYSTRPGAPGFAASPSD